MKTHLRILWVILPFMLLCATGRGNTFDFKAVLSGSSESPPNASPGTGTADVIYDSVAQTLDVTVIFSGLLGTTTASHIHAATAVPLTGTAGVATTVPYFLGFPIGVTSGSYHHVLDLTDLSSYNPTYVTAHGGTASGAEAALVAAMFAHEAYLNIHTTVVPGGEIRGFLALPDVTATAGLLAVAFIAMVGFARLRLSPVTARESHRTAQVD